MTTHEKANRASQQGMHDCISNMPNHYQLKEQEVNK